MEQRKTVTRSWYRPTSFVGNPVLDFPEYLFRDGTLYERIGAEAVGLFDHRLTFSVCADRDKYLDVLSAVMDEIDALRCTAVRVGNVFIEPV